MHVSNIPITSHEKHGRKNKNVFQQVHGGRMDELSIMANQWNKKHVSCKFQSNTSII